VECEMGGMAKMVSFSFIPLFLCVAPTCLGIWNFKLDFFFGRVE